VGGKARADAEAECAAKCGAAILIPSARPGERYEGCCTFVLARGKGLAIPK